MAPFDKTEKIVPINSAFQPTSKEVGKTRQKYIFFGGGDLKGKLITLFRKIIYFCKKLNDPDFIL